MAGMPALVVAAFSFGMLHALLPGHGKSLLAAHYTGEGRWRGAMLSSAILIITITSLRRLVEGFYTRGPFDMASAHGPQRPEFLRT